MIKIKANIIGIKDPIEIKRTINKKEAADTMLRKLLQIDIDTANVEDDAFDENEEITDEEAAQQAIKAINEDEKGIEDIFDFLKETLELTNAQIKKAKKLVDEEELGGFVYYVVARLRGASDEDFDLEQKKDEAAGKVDPKKE